MNRYVSEELRQLVISRASNLCEYCLANIDWTFYGGAVDHIISIQHGGPTEPDNLAYTCQPCNRNKGSNIASLNWQTKQLVRLFNPRTDRWTEHFILDGAQIKPLTEIGEVTLRILDLNHPERIEEREGWIEEGLYPPC